MKSLTCLRWQVKEGIKKGRSDDSSSLRKAIPNLMTPVLGTLVGFDYGYSSEYLVTPREFRGFHCVEYARLLIPREYLNRFDDDPECVDSHFSWPPLKLEQQKVLQRRT